MEFHSISADEALRAVESEQGGLDESQASERLSRYGTNALVGKKRKSGIVRFLKQFVDPMIIVLIIAAVISAVLTIVQGEFTELIDSALILFIVVLNAVIGFVQENKAENALDALRSKNKPFVKVIRSGVQKSIPAEQLTLGDVILLEAGDIVPADIRLLSSASLKIEEAALTGESVPSEKQADCVLKEDAPLGDRANMAFMGSTVTYGRGKGLVVAIGMQTEMGKIATMLNAAEEDASPLTKQLAKTAKILSFLVLGIAIIIFGATMIKSALSPTGITLASFMDAFMTAVAIAVAAIPEGLPAVVTIVLALGVQKMSKKNAIVKNLSSVETLGCCEVICSDKTGTLTLNKMTVKDNFCPSENEQLLRDILVLCNDTTVGEVGFSGDPTETALVEYTFDNGADYVAFTEKNARIDELPFDSVRKLMTTVNKRSDGTYSYTKGATDMLLNRCNRMLTKKGVRPITAEDRAEIERANAQMAERALRVLAAAYTDGHTLDETDLIFVGLVGMIDPPRPEVKAAVEKCNTAGMKALMITGDHLVTACAIARELGILKEGDLTATGAELDKMSDEELNENISKYSVFARVSPENKVKIVKAFRNQNKVVAMTGDGVNDAPSIKEADIGIGMGITGTQVSKEASDMVLADDNFATIVDAVEEGRKIYSNITKAIQFLLSANIAEVLCLFLVTMIMPVGVQFLTPVMILWVNLVTDSFPALSLGTESAEKDIMLQPPRKDKGSLFAGQIGKDIIIQGIMQTILVLSAYFIGELVLDTSHHAVAMTMAFVSLCFIQLFHSYNLRSQRHSVLNKKLFSNKYLNLSFILGVALTLFVVLVPGVNTAFDTTYLTWYEWLIAIGCAFLIVPLVEVQKVIENAISKRKKK